MRLEDNGEVFLSIYDETKYPNRSTQVSVPFSVFADKLPAFIEHLQASCAEVGE